MENNFFTIKDLLKYDKEDFKILISDRKTGFKHAIQHELIIEYEEEIKRAIAICIDFKISFNDMFKDKYINDYAHKIIELPNELYTQEYQEQKIYNEIFKKYYGKLSVLCKPLQKVIFNIERLYNYIAYIFDYDIIKVTTAKKDVK